VKFHSWFTYNAGNSLKKKLENRASKRLLEKKKDKWSIELDISTN